MALCRERSRRALVAGKKAVWEKEKGASSFPRVIKLTPKGVTCCLGEELEGQQVLRRDYVRGDDE